MAGGTEGFGVGEYSRIRGVRWRYSAEFREAVVAREAAGCDFLEGGIRGATCGVSGEIVPNTICCA